MRGVRDLMDREKLAEKKTGSVKEVVSSYRERIGEVNHRIKKFQTNYPEKHFSKTRELHQATRDSNQINESRKLAESVTAETKTELSAANKAVRDLTLRIEESNARAKAQMEELGKLKVGRRKEAESNAMNFESEKVMRELESIKRELSKLKLDMASVLDEKRRAEKETNDSLSKREACLSSVESLEKEIEEINEEHVLVELARIEAIKECEEIGAQRKDEVETYSLAIEETQKKRQNMIGEIEDAKELEDKLAITILDIDMLQSELKEVEEKENGLERDVILKNRLTANYQEEDGSDSKALLGKVMEELEATKVELALVKEEGFQFMSSMDIVRNERKHVAEQTARLKRKEEKLEMTIQNLNSKLLRAKSKLEATSAAQDKAKSIESNLSLTLEQLKLEAETHEKERLLISEETEIVKLEMQRTETEIDLAEERLQDALQDLKEVKSSEAIALENLKAIIEKTVRNRASASRPSSMITISKFEYEYLRGNAAAANEIANKKVEAAQAWVEALKASEKEIQIKSELLRRETREQRVEEEQDIHQAEKSTNATKINDNDFEKWRQMMEPGIVMPDAAALPSKSMNRSMKRTPTRRGNRRSSASPVVHGTSFTVRRRRKVMPNLAKFFSGKGTEGNT